MISVICFSWMLAFASMTVGEASRAVGFFAVRAPSPCHAQSSSGILFPLSSCPFLSGIQGNDSLFLRGVKGRKSGIHALWILAFARMTARDGVAGRDNLSRTVVPPLSSPLGLTRGSRAMIPYFSGALRVGKAELFILDPRVRKDDDWRGVKGGGFLSPVVTPHDVTL